MVILSINSKVFVQSIVYSDITSEITYFFLMMALKVSILEGCTII